MIDPAFLSVDEPTAHAAFRALCAEHYERSLYAYLEAAWPAFDPSPFCGGWHLRAICEHLEAVSAGQIKRLLINCPPRSSKTSAVAIAWPTWTWSLRPNGSPLRGPGVRFLCASYGARKAQEDGVTARRLLGSEWYQNLWGDHVIISPHRDNAERYDTTAGGSRINTGIPESLGKGGMIRLLDDVHKTDEVESQDVREGVIRAYREVWSTRSNDPEAGAEVLIMQRLHQRDLSGYWLESANDVVHLNIPAEWEGRSSSTRIGWRDPRKELGESYWPARWPLDKLAEKRDSVGEYGWSGQFQQRPAARGGGIIKESWWQQWPPDGEEAQWTRAAVDEDGRTKQITTFPDFDLVIVSVDGAYTEKEENDWCACTVWGVFTRREIPKVMLLHAWRDRLELHDFVRRIIETCEDRHADHVLVEGKGPGLSAIQEMKRLTRRAGDWMVHGIDPGRQDKAARLHKIAPMFNDGVIYAPKRKWAQMVIDEMAVAPKGRWDDLADTASQALSWLRRNGLAKLHTEAVEDNYESALFRGKSLERNSVAERYGV